MLFRSARRVRENGRTSDRRGGVERRVVRPARPWINCKRYHVRRSTRENDGRASKPLVRSRRHAARRWNRNHRSDSARLVVPSRGHLRPRSCGSRVDHPATRLDRRHNFVCTRSSSLFHCLLLFSCNQNLNRQNERRERGARARARVCRDHLVFTQSRVDDDERRTAHRRCQECSQRCARCIARARACARPRQRRLRRRSHRSTAGCTPRAACGVFTPHRARSTGKVIKRAKTRRQHLLRRLRAVNPA